MLKKTCQSSLRKRPDWLEALNPPGAPGNLAGVKCTWPQPTWVTYINPEEGTDNIFNHLEDVLASACVETSWP